MSRGKKKGGERTLTQELAAFLSKVLVPDLRERAKVPEVHNALEKRYQYEKAANRTAEHFVEWVARTVEQVGAAWVLSCVFIRTLEDRELLGQHRLAGPGAKDAYGQFIELAPSLTARDYLLLVFREVASLPAAEDVLGPQHNPAWRLSPSHEAARKLLDFFQEEDAGGALKWTFTGTDTRFLGDLYQDLSEDVRKRYALLQTPNFVEKFILDLTLEPAIKEFGLEEVLLIDPTCGSGHFLLGAFERLFEQRRLKAPGLNVKQHAEAALAQVYGVDLNPYAVAIARFRLTLAFLEKAEIGKLSSAPPLSLKLVVADSLLYGGRHQSKLSDLDEDRTRWGDEMFDLEDAVEARRIFGQRYHAVVGNPPYITCKDAALRDAYRDRYDSCFREYALAAPFTERFFELAVESGFVGLINANSFMKREFGKRLIEAVLPRYELTRVIDTSGAYIPDHGTPTVLLFGRNQKPVSDTVVAVLGKKGEPATPLEPENGKVWSSIAEYYNDDGFENEFISVAALGRSTLSRHPWSLGGGGATELKTLLEGRSACRLSDIVGDVGFGCMTRADGVYFVPRHALKAAGLVDESIIENVEGVFVRDWAVNGPNTAVFPYDDELRPVSEQKAPPVHRFLWPYRVLLWTRREPNGDHRELGLTWWEWSRFQKERFRNPISIAFAFIATHNHFVLDRGGKVFNRSAPIIKLAEGVSEEEHFGLLGYLNSSTACFWMKQVFFDKGNRGEGGGITAESWEKFFEHDGTKLKNCPIPVLDERIRELAVLLERAANERLKFSPAAAIECWSTVGGSLAEGLSTFRQKSESMEGKVRWLQEELDWAVYGVCGLPVGLSTTLPDALDDVPERPRGSRPSDILYARLAMASEVTTRYFELCHLPAPSEIVSAPVAVIDSERLALIEKSEHLRLIETPTYKRTFREGHRPWRADDALRNAIRGILERTVSSSKVDGRAVSMRELVTLANDGGALGGLVECLRQGEAQVGPEEIVRDLVLGEAVPYLAAWRHTESGMSKRHAWEQAWSAQRLEDAGERVGIQVPPKYKAEDYRSYVYFQMRGELDVPRERFILYPGEELDSGGGPLLGWAGWNHLQRAGALAALYQEHKTQNGMDAERLTPLLAGLLELVPWIQQWHNEPNPDFNGERLGDYYAQFVKEEARSLGLTLDDLRNWRPVKKAPAKKRGSKKKPADSGTQDEA
ncbi:BREX-2 system adenine-specific DNA-methyltransferase PglX [Myxococcus vastator]|uniref:BREX-2 system adenine-specific DNA-methyltransferase PglX n=1 Tax=Myxococcus vastator TaxID=2709664 RepID=UPI0013D657A3|nr:BREX-2 system adenine-specific DNA-methyltransferase PglX [Myxococcus vastator]